MATIEVRPGDEFDMYDSCNIAQFRDGMGRAPGQNWYSAVRMRRGPVTLSHQEAVRLLKLAGHNVVEEGGTQPQSVAMLVEEVEKLRQQVKDLTEELQQERDRANKAAEYAEGCNAAMKMAVGAVWLFQKVKANPQGLYDRGNALLLDKLLAVMKADEFCAAELFRIDERDGPEWPVDAG